MAWFTTRRQTAVAIFFVVISFPVLFLLQLSLGQAEKCNFGPEKVQVLGYQVKEPVVYLLLDGPVFCYMPYSDGVAEKVQNGLQAGQKGGKLMIRGDGDEGPSFDIQWPKEQRK